MLLDNIHKHLFGREYMSGVEREQVRIKATGEVFTPTPLVEEILNNMDPELFTDSTKTLLDPSCGDGQFLASILYRKVENGIDFETALSTLYGVELMPDNVEECRKRLLCGREDLRHIVETNIVCHNALTYDYSFNGTNFTDKELQDQLTGADAMNSAPVVKIKKVKQKSKSDLSAFDIE
jgi:type I restriction-modification system DNA methylase subunit